MPSPDKPIQEEDKKKTSAEKQPDRTIQLEPRVVQPVKQEDELEEELEEEENQPVTYRVPHPTKKEMDTDDEFQELLKDFIKKFGATNYKEGGLCFPTEADAKSFLTEQATKEPPREFLMVRADENLNPLDYHYLSCGTKKLYEGALNDIIDALNMDIKEASDPDMQEKMQASLSRLTGLRNNRFKEQTQQFKEVANSSPAEEPQNQNRSGPTPG